MAVHVENDIVKKIDECIFEAIDLECFDTAYLLRMAKMNFVMKTNNISDDEFDYILSMSRSLLYKKMKHGK